jgi:hypothetical protein
MLFWKPPGMLPVFATDVIGAMCGPAMQAHRIGRPPHSAPRRFAARSVLVQPRSLRA